MGQEESGYPPGWSVDGSRASVTVRARDFLHAVELVQRIARVAEELDHHPDLHLERYRWLRVVTWSHDVGGLTARDERLAWAVHDILSEAGVADAQE